MEDIQADVGPTAAAGDATEFSKQPETHTKNMKHNKPILSFINKTPNFE